MLPRFIVKKPADYLTSDDNEGNDEGEYESEEEGVDEAEEQYDISMNEEENSSDSSIDVGEPMSLVYHKFQEDYERQSDYFVAAPITAVMNRSWLEASQTTLQHVRFGIDELFPANSSWTAIHGVGEPESYRLAVHDSC